MTASSTSSPPVRFVLLGGFLGSGKTTTIARLAQHYQHLGRNVAVVTNDKAADSVDALRLRAQGLNVGEMPGACFCGNVDELIEMVDVLGAAARPDVVFAEPVGSCLDVAGTVIRPLERSYGRRFEVAPYGVLVKPTHAAKILRGNENAGVSPQAAYIFRRQLAEADFAMINRCDQLSEEQIVELRQLLTDAHPETPVLGMSAKTGFGCEALIEMLERRGEFGRRVVSIDYDAYAAGEAEMGWLNATLLATANDSLDVDSFLLDLLRRVQVALNAARAEAAHVKLIALGGGRHGAANLIGNAVDPELTQTAGCRLDRFQLIVNARAACAPPALQSLLTTSWNDAARAVCAVLETVHFQCFSPGRPVVGTVFEAARWD